MLKLQVGDRVRLTEHSCGFNPGTGGAVAYVDLNDDRCTYRIRWDGSSEQFWCVNSKLVPDKSKVAALATKEQKAIAKAEADLAALKERAALKAKQAADRKAKAERAKVMRGLSPAGRRVVAMLQAGSASDFGCQREAVIKLVAAITGDKPDAINKAVAH